MENAPENDIVDDIIRWESGEMDDPVEVILFFARLIETGMAWQLQGSVYGKPAKALIDQGYISTGGEVLRFP